MQATGLSAGSLAGNQREATLVTLVSEIHQVITQIEERQRVVDSAIQRLINPTPVNVTGCDKSSEPPDSSNHESQLRLILRRLQLLYQNEGEQSDLMTGAV